MKFESDDVKANWHIWRKQDKVGE